ncbi:esterase/lipase family protein [Fodinicola acaciae]|uniref:esterase/lipase family protein n=1 Tax=Fodinicola acaciae TaxID=2681555 RepID=UPI0013D60B8A|nr:alpha/beta fold hydrolase [Fodinicola acaciae]
MSPARRLVWLLAVAAAFASPATPAHAAEKRPVILVHGFLGSASDFAPMVTALRNAGYPTYAINLPGQENVANANAIAQAVQTARAQHGNSKVELVSHSMGGLSTRYYVKFLGGTDTVVNFVTLGSGPHGTDLACALPLDFGGQMCPTSAFLANLNAGDQTPGDIRYAQLFGDEQIDLFDGGWCHAAYPTIMHADEPKSPVFANAVMQILSGQCPAS